MKKSQLLELTLRNLPTKKLKIDEAAAEFNVELLRLPDKHCTLNPIDLAWPGFKQHFRKHNASFVNYLMLISN